MGLTTEEIEENTVGTLRSILSTGCFACKCASAFFRTTQIRESTCERPAFKVPGGAQEFYLGPLEFEGYVLQGNEAFAVLGAGVVEIVERSGAGIHASLDRGESFLRDFEFELSDVAGSLHLGYGSFQAENF